MMPKDSSEGRTDKKIGVRTTREIKAGLLRRAFDGNSPHTPDKMIKMIQDAITRAHDIPADHLEILKGIDHSQPRSVMMLNAIALHLGLAERYTDTTTHNIVRPSHLTMQ